MQDEKTPDAAVIGQMFSSMVKIIKKTSSFERKLQKMVEEARSLSTEASDVCEALMSSDSFPSQVNAQEIRILLDFRQEAGRGEDADRAQTPENPSKRRFTPPTPLSSRDSHSDREYPRSPRVRSSVVSEQSALGSSPTYDGSDGYASGVTATTGDHLEHIEEAPVAQTTQNKEIDLSQIAEYNQGGTAPSAKRSRYDDPHYMYSPCSNCALVNLACDGNPGIVCSACLTDHPNSYCIYEPAHRKPKWKMSEAQLLAITSNPFREPVVIGGRRYQKTDAEWDGIQENQKRKYLKCLEIEGAGGVDASPPCGECVKAGVRCRAPAPETSYGKQNKNNLAKGNAQCARCRLVGKSAACSLILRSPAKCSPSGAGSKEDGLGQPSTVDGGQLGLGDPRSDESMPFPTSTPTPEDVGLLFEEWIPDLGPGFEFF
ncbi:hypothetical protein BU16DRAFT_531321 [Lophium mytilinum]|uniref:Uncharacterized protein n=1 Tax=Lophium mytilinum TaxID=390894 RepID=A0A6A6QCV3_9PEZI|nr:hypothetical protein BU16DRAFT_531321 [Lophium mytilinum]